MYCDKITNEHTNNGLMMHIVVRFVSGKQFPHDNPKRININLNFGNKMPKKNDITINMYKEK